ncbi:MAG: acetyl-coenzyme synthetase, partial [Deltaproteobacteria bacterium]|nr:acetyl-coenzyme synthetase [Deltaproteobacteria bacterium]
MAAESKTISSVSLEGRVFKVPEALKKTAYIKGVEEYNKIYQRSIDDPDGFWAECAEQLHWYKKWDKVESSDFKSAKIEWFRGGKLNVSDNCLDRNLATRKNKPALIWEGEPEGDSKTFTYQQLHDEVCRFANVLKKKGVKKGDRVSIYLPMIPELAIAMLACTRIGAIHSIVFGGFSAEALRDRIQDCGSTVVITSDGSYRSGKVIDLKKSADKAIEESPTVKICIVCKRTGS